MRLKHSLSFMLGLAFMAAAAIGQTTAHEGHHTMDHDVMFADGMTKHHRDGIKMAQMAVEKAQSAELRSMAQKMIDDQTREIDEMQRLRGAAPMTPMAEMMKMPGMMAESKMQQDMARLEAATGQTFDVAFTEIMPKHHDGAIKMSKHELANGDNSGLRTIAQQIAEKQSRERDQLVAIHRSLSGGETRAMASSSTERRRMTKD
jgi:uncharacterized protein (DUF305 family)